MSASSFRLPAAPRSNPFPAFLVALWALNSEATAAAAGNHEAAVQPAPGGTTPLQVGAAVRASVGTGATGMAQPVFTLI